MFLEAYLDEAGDAIFSTVGGSDRGQGSATVRSHDGDYFSILGLPLLPLLAWLRDRGTLTSRPSRDKILCRVAILLALLAADPQSLDRGGGS
jgi:hypothetical protein